MENKIITKIGLFNYLNKLPFLKSDDIAYQLKKKYYALIPALFNSSKLASKDWNQFKKSWDNLWLDTFMRDGGKYRYRRYSVFTWRSQFNKLIIEEKQPHYQSLDYNHLNGDIDRHFELFEDLTISNPIFNNIMTFCLLVLSNIHKNQDWHIEAHQHRIVAQHGQIGLPTPEGIHQDGRDYVMIMFIGKKGIKGGKTTIYDNNQKPLLNLTLKNPSETILLNDRQMMHGVSPIKLCRNSFEGTRDVLVITFQKKT
jgi:hypothetical protein